MFCVGIDPAITNPVQVIYTGTDLYFYFFSNRKREINLTYDGVWSESLWKHKMSTIINQLSGKKSRNTKRIRIGEGGRITIPLLDEKKCGLPLNIEECKLLKETSNIKVHVCSLPAVSSKTEPREKRYSKIAHAMIEPIKKFEATMGMQPKIGIEGYAYDEKNRDATIKTIEFGGTLRHLFYQQGWSYTEFAPSTIKKYFTCDYRADKYKMTQQFIQWCVIHNLLQLFEFQELTISVQHPLQDIADAFAVLHYMLLTVWFNGAVEELGRKRR